MDGHKPDRLEHRKDIAVHCGDRPYLYKPDEILVARKDAGRLDSALKTLGSARRRSETALGVEVFTTGNRSGHEAVRFLRSAVDPEPLVAPHHVCSGSPKWAGGPAVPPTATTVKIRLPGKAGEVRVAVLDTGYSAGLNAELDDHVPNPPTAAEDTDALPSNGWLDDEAGHGTFIASIVAARAPNATIEIEQVLGSDGMGFELDIAAAILRCVDSEVDVINLSLGGYSEDDRLPLGIAAALRQVRADQVVVAAAGNDCGSRPFWPAAATRVIAVGAIDDTDRPAPFTNFGNWVDCCAVGVDVPGAFLVYDETPPVQLTPTGLAGRSPQDFQAWATWSGTSFSAPYVAGRIADHKLQGGFSSAWAAAVDLLASAQDQVPNLGVIVR